MPSNYSLPYLLIPPSCDTTPMPARFARHWYDVEFERSRSAMTGVLESLIPTTNAALALAYGRHFGHVAIIRIRALDTMNSPTEMSHNHSTGYKGTPGLRLFLRLLGGC